VVGEAPGARRQAGRARVRIAAAVAAGAAALALACASAGDPPGGPPDTTPPHVVRTVPESGAVLTSPPGRAEIVFDEVISEQVAGNQKDIQGAVILSPVTGKVTVDWRRYRITVEPKGGFQPGRIYRLELLPVISDLRQNRMKRGALVVFSTGPALPTATLRGTVVDWTAKHGAAGALIEAMLLPDSLPYRALADSGGNFTMPQMPAGEYLVYGVVDQNGDRRREPREPFDTVRVTLQDSAAVELFAFAHDTVGPRLRSVDLLDSLTLRLTFDRPLDPAQAPDTSMVHVAPADDSTRLLPISAVLTPTAYDSVTKAAAAAAARDTMQRREPSAGAGARDTTQRRQPSRGAAAPAGVLRRQGRGAQPPLGTPGAPRPDTTVATRMLARRPPPTDNRIVRLPSALQPGSRYQVSFSGFRGLTGVENHGHATLLVPKRAAPRAATRSDSLRATRRADTTHVGPRPDSARATLRSDSLRAPSPPDSTPPRRDSAPVAPRPDALPARPDTARPAAPRPALAP
jgi:hypothetical protein